MRLGVEIPYGRRVRVVHDFNDREIHPYWPSPIIPAGSEGVVRSGPYSSGVFNYEIECPVQLDSTDGEPGDTEGSIGISWDALELIS